LKTPLVLCAIALRDHGSQTVSQLARSTGLSRPTVESALAALTERGLVQPDELTPGGRDAGRPAKVFRFGAEHGYVAGIDVGLHTMRVMIANLAGAVDAYLEIPLPVDLPGADRLHTLVTLLDDSLAACSVERKHLLAIGVAVSGIVGHDGWLSVSHILPAWTDLDIAGQISAEFGCPVKLENDIRSAALAEQHLGAARMAETVVYVLAGHRVAVSLIIGGKLHRGRHSAAGEVGALAFSQIIGPDGGIAWTTGETAEDVFAQAAAGDQRSVDEIDGFIERIAPGIATLALVIDPDVVVLGGGISRAGARIMPTLRQAVNSHIAIPIHPKLVASELGAESVVVGALIRALEMAGEDIYGSDGTSLPAMDLTTAMGAKVTGTAVDPAKDRAAQASSPALTANLRVGIVGVGSRGYLGAKVEASGLGRIVAAADPSPLGRRRAQDLFGSDIVLTSSHQGLIELEPRLDAVIVTSPDDTHATVATDFLRAGIPVYLEKPVATVARDADDVLQAALDSGTKLYVGHNMRHMAVVRIMRDVIARGEIGEVKAIWCRHFVGNGGDYYFKDWHADREHSTGLLLQKGAHDIDIIHWLAGGYSTKVVAMGDLAVYGDITDRRDNTGQLMPDWFSLQNWPPLSQRGLNPTVNVEDISMVSMELDNGVLASYEQCHFTPDYWRNYTVIGTEGRLENFGDGNGGVVKVWNQRTTYSAEADKTYPIIEDEQGHGDADLLTMAEFLRFVIDGEPTQTSPVAARNAVMTAIAATQSLRNGAQPNPVPPVSEEISRYFENNQKLPSITRHN
jgi:predicted dehydrogenase/predicted NBD/HSP70 family sugar kinase